MKNLGKVLFTILIFVCIVITPVLATTSNPFNLTDEEVKWLSDNKDRVFTMGIDPYSGMEYFKYKGEEKGYLLPLIAQIEKDLKIDINLETTKSWGEVFSGLQEGSVDILFGANETPERDKFMSFTKPVYKTPYAIIAKKNSNIHTIGDIDNKTVGFISDDVVIDELPSLYKNIKYNYSIFGSQEEGVRAVNEGSIDAFITSGGPVVYDYLYRYPDLDYAFKLNAITSDMTFSTRREDKILADILDKYIGSVNLSDIINQGEIDFNIKIMNLTPDEINWLKNDGQAVVGITKDYLPFDYYDNNDYKGISGEIIKEISKKTGIKFSYVYEDFDSLAQNLKDGNVNILNIAKTDDRTKYILYPEPYSTERDIIVGRKDSKYVTDIFGLESKRVAVIKGFWHYEMLTKNLTNVKIVETNNIQESMKLVHNGKADYLIENPTVVRYYTEELQLYDLVQKGNTSTASYLYYGISKNKPELASIINKVLPLMDIPELTRIGYDEVPHVRSNLYQRNLIFTIIGLLIIIVFIILYLVKLINALIREKTESELLRQREHFLYTDSLTELHNRNYFDDKIKPALDSRPYPQTIVVADMNNLKIVNDNYGHHMGDKLLKSFADVLLENIPEGNVIIRLGGDEFLVIIDNADESKTDFLIDTIRKSVCQKDIMTNNNEIIKAEAALGYATRTSAEIGFDSLFKIADERMYEDKKRKTRCI